MISNVFAHLKTKPPKVCKVGEYEGCHKIHTLNVHIYTYIYIFYIYTFLGGTCIIIKDVDLTLARVFVCFFFETSPGSKVSVFLPPGQGSHRG